MTKETDRVLAQLLDECAELLIAGESVSACLSRYPEHADALEPMLRSVTVIRQLDGDVPRSATAAAKSRAAFMAAAAALPAQPKEPERPRGLAAWWAAMMGAFQGMRPLPVGLGAALAVVLLLGLLTTGVVTASADALPGDALYQVKLATEQARMFLAHDDAARQALMNEIQQRRVWEASEIQKRWRPVDRMPLLGKLESFGPRKWRVSGLDILINNRTTIVGVPVVGGMVRGTIRAPGDGTLVGVYLEVLPPTELTQLPSGPQQVVLVPTEAPEPTPWVVTATPVPTRTPLVIEPVTATPPEPFPSRTPSEPRDTATSRPVLLPTRSVTPILPTATLAPLPTSTVWETPPRPESSTSWLRTALFEGITTDQVVIEGYTFQIDDNTVFEGDPQPGDQVDLQYKVHSDGTRVALVVRVVRKAATPAPIEFTGRVQKIAGDTWVVLSASDEQTVKLVPGTLILEDPQINDPVKVTGERHLDGVHAKTIEKLLPEEVQFTGVTREILAESWLVESGELYRVYLTTSTVITGQPGVGRVVDVGALKDQLDDRLTARLLYVYADTATPSPSPTATETSTPAPTDTPVPTDPPIPAAPASPAPSPTSGTPGGAA